MQRETFQFLFCLHNLQSCMLFLRDPVVDATRKVSYSISVQSHRRSVYISGHLYCMFILRIAYSF